MLRKILGAGGGSSSEPQLRLFLRDLSRYPGDDLYGVVYLHLPVEAQVLLLEVHVTGKERARIGMLAGGANFEARDSIYYNQNVTMLGVVPEKVCRARAKATAAAQDPPSSHRRSGRVRNSMNKQASLRDPGLPNGGGGAGNNGGDDECSEDASVPTSTAYALTVVSEAQVVRLAAGTYTFPFHIVLPDVMPPTRSIVKGKDASCKMEYSVRSDLLVRSGKHYHDEGPLTIRALPVQLQRWLQLHRPINAPKHFPIGAAPPGAVVSVEGPDGEGRRTSYAGVAAPGGHGGTVDASETEGFGIGGSMATMTTHADGGGEMDTPASPQGKPTQGFIPSADDLDMEGSDGEHELVLRRCIDHRVEFSVEELAREDAELVERQRQKHQEPRKDMAANAGGGTGASASPPANNESDEDAVFMMDGGKKATAGGDGIRDRRKAKKPARDAKGRTRMLAAEIEQIGYREGSTATSATADTASSSSEDSEDGDAKKQGAGAGAAAAAAPQQVEPEDAAEGGKRHRHRHRHHTEKDDADQPGAQDETAANASVSPPSRTLREPIWEQKFLIPLRSGLMSKSPVGVHMILHSNVLCSGQDKVRVSLIIDNTRGGGPITKVRYSLVVREMIRSHSETYPFSRVEAEQTSTQVIAKGKIARLPLVELPVPATTPNTIFTEGGFSSTFLNIRLYSSTALKTYSRSAELELLVVGAVDVKNESRRLRRWTNYFVGRGLPRQAESAPAIDLNAVNQHPRVLDAAALMAAEDAGIAESLAGDCYSASIAPLSAMSVRHAGATRVPPSAPTAGGGSANGVPSSSASLLSLRTHISVTPQPARGSGIFSRTRGLQPQPDTIPARMRRSLDFHEPTYLPLTSGVLGAPTVGSAGSGFADPMMGVNPLMAPRQESVAGDSEDRSGPRRSSAAARAPPKQELDMRAEDISD